MIGEQWCNTKLQHQVVWSNDYVCVRVLIGSYMCEYSLGTGDGQRSLVCCRPWICKESDTTEAELTDWLIGWQKIKHMFLVSDLVTWGATIWDNLMQRMHDLMYFFSPSPDNPLASSCHTFSPHQLSQPRAILTLREVAMHHPDLCDRSHSGIHLPKLTVLAFTIFSGVALWEMLHSRLCPLPVLMWVKDLAYCLNLGQLEMASPAADYLMFFAKV